MFCHQATRNRISFTRNISQKEGCLIIMQIALSSIYGGNWKDFKLNRCFSTIFVPVSVTQELRVNEMDYRTQHSLQFDIILYITLTYLVIEIRFFKK